MSLTENIHTDFTPDLRKRGLSEDARYLLEHWGMPYIGKPVPAAEGKKSALWHGSFNRYGETPVMVVVCKQELKVVELSAVWFCGIALKELLDAADQPEIAYLDAATQRTADQYTAIDTLSVLLST